MPNTLFQNQLVSDGGGGGEFDGLKYGIDRINAPIVDTGINQLKNLSTSPGIGMPKLPAFQAPEVYKPDYGKLEGNFNSMLSGFEDLKNSYMKSSETFKTDLSGQLSNLLGEIDTSRTRNRTNLGETQRVIQEDAFDRNRALDQQMSARGLGGSGLAQLAGIKERMATGQNISEATQNFYQNEENLLKTIDQANQNYNMSVQKVNDSLHTALATINNQQNALKSDYTQQVMALERQVIADLNASKQAKMQYDMAMADYSLRAQQANAELRQADRQYALQLDAIARANEKPQLTRTQVNEVLMSSMGDKFRMDALLDMGFSKSEATSIMADFSKQFGKDFGMPEEFKGLADEIGGGNTPKPKEEFSPLLKQTEAPTSTNPYGKVSINQSNVDKAIKTFWDTLNKVQSNSFR